MGEAKLILVISDSHIPERAYEIDRAFLDFFRSKKYDVVVHAGDLIREYVLDLVKSLGGRSYVVQGNMDYLPLPESQVFEEHGLRIGVVHGDQVYPRGNVPKLTNIARRLNASILVSGHTHSPFIKLDQGVLHVNPGSVTGVWGGGGGSMKPSFIELKVLEDRSVEVYLYELSRYEQVLLVKTERYKLT